MSAWRSSNTSSLSRYASEHIMKTTLGLLALLSAGLAMTGCSTSKPEPAAAPQPLVRPDVHAAYMNSNKDGYDWFANASDAYNGVPLIVLRSLPDLAPEIWGAPDEQFAKFGYLPNPDGPLPI